FQIDEDTLYQFVLAIMHLDERPRVRVLARRDRFDRFVSVMVFVPRERYDSAAREKIGAYLARLYVGRVSAFYPFFPEGPLVRLGSISIRGARAIAPASASRYGAAKSRSRSLSVCPCWRTWAFALSTSAPTGSSPATPALPRCGCTT